MSRKRRSLTTEYKVEAARRVIDSGRTIAEVARELAINVYGLSQRGGPDPALPHRAPRCASELARRPVRRMTAVR